MAMDDRIRTSDADRERVTARLRDHFAEGRLTRIIGVAADITEQMAAQHELRETRGDLHELIHNLPLAAALVNDRGQLEYINRRFSKTFGYELEEIAEPDTWRRFIPAAAHPGEDTFTRECEIAGKDGVGLDLWKMANAPAKFVVTFIPLFMAALMRVWILDIRGDAVTAALCERRDHEDEEVVE